MLIHILYFDVSYNLNTLEQRIFLFGPISIKSATVKSESEKDSFQK